MPKKRKPGNVMLFISLEMLLTDNQTIGFTELMESGGIIKGKGKGDIFTGGYQIPKIKVEIIRP